jgi:hypothetical protein
LLVLLNALLKTAVRRIFTRPRFRSEFRVQDTDKSFSRDLVIGPHRGVGRGKSAFTVRDVRVKSLSKNVGRATVFGLRNRTGDAFDVHRGREYDRRITVKIPESGSENIFRGHQAQQHTNPLVRVVVYTAVTCSQVPGPRFSVTCRGL